MILRRYQEDDLERIRAAYANGARRVLFQGHGKIEYFHLMTFDSRAVSDAFSAAVIRAMLEFAPSAFEDEDL
jgi:hypothetical protein